VRIGHCAFVDSLRAIRQAVVPELRIARMPLTPFETCAPLTTAAIGSTHWLADPQGAVWLLRWGLAHWSHSDGANDGVLPMYRRGWRYLGPHDPTLWQDMIDIVDAGVIFERNGLIYRDPRCAERSCEQCEQRYRGPGVYCCLRCALSDA
jgi:hypothetical protein